MKAAAGGVSTPLPNPNANVSGSSSRVGEPTRQAMMRAMSSGHAYIGEDSWSGFRVGSLSDRLYNFFNSASYVNIPLLAFIYVRLSPLHFHFVSLFLV